MHPGPMVRLNLIIAQSRILSAEFALNALENVSDDDRKRLRPWWDCAIADAFEQLSRPSEAIAHLSDALALSANAAQRRLIEQKLSRPQNTLQEFRFEANEGRQSPDNPHAPESRNSHPPLA